MLGELCQVASTVDEGSEMLDSSERLKAFEELYLFGLHGFVMGRE